MIVFIHELGHTITGKLLGFQLDRIELYPYGGCSKLQYDINTAIIKEFFVLIMGPISQIVFVGIVYLLKAKVDNHFYLYNHVILLFNLLPIYPLDGGRLVHLIISRFFSYYYSLKGILYFSYVLYVGIIVYSFCFPFNFIWFIILLLLGMTLRKEIVKADYYYHKFLTERYLKDYHFAKNKTVHELKEMRRDYHHYFIKKDKILKEKEMLKLSLEKTYHILV